MEQHGTPQTDAAARPAALGVNKRPPRADQLQFLRFLAFCLVFIWHANDWSFSFFSGGVGAACAVSFFFMLSGLATGYTHFEDDIAVTPRAIGAYMWRKIKKLYPLYIFTMLFAVTSSKIPKLVAQHDFAGLKEPLTLLLRNALMIQSWFTSDYFSYNGVGWFISAMIFMYLLTLPLLALAGKIRRSRRPAAGYCVMIAGCMLVSTLYCYLMPGEGWEFTEYVFPVARMWEYAIGIGLGCLTRLILQRHPESRPARRRLFTLAELAVFALWIAMPYTPYERWSLTIARWLVPNALLLLTFAIGEGGLSRVFRARPLVALGDLSFECFLLHGLILTRYSKELAALQGGRAGNALRQSRQAGENLTQNSALGNAFNLLLCLLLTLMLARLIHGPTRPERHASPK